MEARKTKTGLLKLLLLAFVLWLLTGIGVFAEQATVTVRLDGIQDYDQAKQVYEMVNQERAAAGANALVWDAQLTQDAMQRAAELAVYYDHTRPDGTRCFTAVTNYGMGYTYGENIAVYQTDASDVMNAWMNSSGHRENILKPVYREIGVGSFYHNGHYHWVQLFSSGAHTANTRTGQVPVTVSVEVLPVWIALSISPSTGTIYEKETFCYTVYNINQAERTINGKKVKYGYKAELRVDDFTWSSSNKSAAQINGSGLVTAGSVGSAQITASIGGKSASASLTVSHNPGAWVTAKAATCGAAGSRNQTCTQCGVVLATEAIPATGLHDYVTKTDRAATCTAAGQSHQECSVCGYKTGYKTISALGHRYGPFKVKKEASISRTGIKTRACRRCDYTQDRSIAKKKPTIKLAKTTLTVGLKQTVSAPKVTYQNGDKIRSWKSSNKSVATVNSKGKITGKKAGTARITVTLKSGKKATLKVTVKKISTTKLKINKKSLTLKKGKTYTLKTSVTPKNSQDKLTFKSSNKKVATVSSKGKITAKKKGTAKITVQSGAKKVVCTVKVKS